MSVDLRNVELGSEGGRTGAVSRLAIFARLLDAEGREVESHYRIFEIPHGRETSEEFEYLVPFSVAPGDYRAEVTPAEAIPSTPTAASLRIRS